MKSLATEFESKAKDELVLFVSRRLAHYYFEGAISAKDYKSLTHAVAAMKYSPRLFSFKPLRPYIEEAIEKYNY